MLLNLFTCLLFTLLNLSSCTFSTKILAFPKVRICFDLHSSLCLGMLARILLMDLILPCSSCFSAVLIIFLAISVLKVVFNLILTGTHSLEMHLRVKILWFLQSQSPNWSLSNSLNSHSASLPLFSTIIWCRFLILLNKS